MTFPQGPASMTPSTITQYISNMQSQLDEATRQTLYSAIISAGGLTIRQGGAFVIQNAAGSYNVLETKTRYMNDGSTYQPVVINRPPSGEQVFAVIPTALSSSSVPFFWAFFDRAGNYAITDDAVSGKGLAKPYIGVPMTPRFTPLSSTVSGQTEQFLSGYLQFNPATTVSGFIAYEGRIPWASHPKISINGVWGWTQGSHTPQPTYTLVVGSQTFSWQPASNIEVSTQTFDISSQVGSADLAFQLKVSYGFTDQYIACSVNGAWLRGS